MLELEQFNVLVEIERGMGDSACEFLHMDPEHYKEIFLKLCSQGYVNEGRITEEGRQALEPYRVKRAIFMAAGFGSRMVPLTYSIPKPLIKVGDRRIIETLLDAVMEAGIEEIWLVRGYQAETFQMLLEKYPMIHFLENPDYDKANNISSAYVMRNLMANAYVLESDLVLYNKRVIRKYEYTTNYLGRATEYTDDWCFRTEDGFVKELLVGGTQVSHMYGISYWNEEDAAKMAVDIKNVYFGENGAKKYWDEVSMRDCREHYHIMVKPVYEGDILEIDTFEELKAIDERYRG
jgi:CTP:phosphocholine cytidylyltransferase-like protein